MNKTDEVRVPVLLTNREFSALLTGLQETYDYCEEQLEAGEDPDFWLEERQTYEKLLEEFFAVFRHYSVKGVWTGHDDE